MKIESLDQIFYYQPHYVDLYKNNFFRNAIAQNSRKDPYCNAKIMVCNDVIAIGNDATQNDVFGNFGAKTFYVNCQTNLCSLGRIWKIHWKTCIWKQAKQSKRAFWTQFLVIKLLWKITYEIERVATILSKQANQTKTASELILW